MHSLRLAITALLDAFNAFLLHPVLLAKINIIIITVHVNPVQISVHNVLHQQTAINAFLKLLI